MPNYQGVWSLTTQMQNASDWQADNYTGSLGFIFGGQNASSTLLNTIESIKITSAGGNVDFGDTIAAIQRITGFSSSTRAVAAGGNTGSKVNTIQYITMASSGDASDFGDLDATRDGCGGLSNSTRGVIGLGNDGTFNNVIQYITIGSTGNASDFGDLTVARIQGTSTSNTTRGIFAGGAISGNTSNVIDYITIASTGNAIDFGDLSTSREQGLDGRGSNATRAVFCGGSSKDFGGDTPQNIIEYVTIASTGNATDFGDLSAARLLSAAVVGGDRLLVTGGSTAESASTVVNIMEFVTITNTGSATDFGDLGTAKHAMAGTSDGHGGIA
jgi:hypothetical protein